MALLRLNGGGRTDGMRRRRGMPRAGGMNGAHFRTLWAEERRADQGMKKSVVGIKPNGSCYFFSGERGEEEREREKKEKNPRLTNASDDRLALFPPPSLPISL